MTRGLGFTPSAGPLFSFCLVAGGASLFTVRILDLDILSGSLTVALCSFQLVTVDSKVKRNLNTENSELPRPSTHLRIPMIEFETEGLHVTVTCFCALSFWNVWTVCGLFCGLVITPSLYHVWDVQGTGGHTVPGCVDFGWNR